MNGIEQALLPVRVRTYVDTNPDTGLAEQVNYVECRNGEVLTGNLPFDWAHYIATCMNSRLGQGRCRVSAPLALLRLDGEPLDKGAVTVAAQRKDGRLSLVDAPFYDARIEAYMAQGEDIVMSRWTQFPICGRVMLSCTFHVGTMKEHQLPRMCGWVTDVLYALNIIKAKSLVATLDGSFIARASGDPHTHVCIRHVEGFI